MRWAGFSPARSKIQRGPRSNISCWAPFQNRVPALRYRAHLRRPTGHYPAGGRFVAITHKRCRCKSAALAGTRHDADRVSDLRLPQSPFPYVDGRMRMRGRPRRLTAFNGSLASKLAAFCGFPSSSFADFLYGRNSSAAIQHRMGPRLLVDAGPVFDELTARQHNSPLSAEPTSSRMAWLYFR